MTRSRVLPRSPLYTLLCCLWLLALAFILPAQASAMTVSPPAGSNLGSFPAGVDLSVALSASGGDLPMTGWYDCDLSNANCLPGDLVIEESNGSASTTIHGVPNVSPGTYNFSITVFDNSSWQVVPYSITITGAGPTVTGLSPSSGSTAGGNTVTISGTGFTGVSAVRFGASAALAFSVNSSTQITATAPSGSAGVVDVVVTTAGGTSLISSASRYSYATSPTAGPVSATVAANSSNNSITLNVSGAAATSVAVASQASHGTASASGTSISYTPTTGFSGSDSFTYTATNANGTSAAATVSVTVSPPSLTITPGALANGTAGVAYDQTLSSANGTAPYTYALISGSLPPGVTLSSAGVFSGTPSSAGTSNLTIRSTDQYGAIGTINYTISVAAPAISVMPPTLPAGTYGAPYSQAISATGGNGSYSFSVLAGALPDGLSLSGGTLSGTPTNAGSYSFTLRATDGNSFTGTRAYTMTIATPTLSLTPLSVANGIAGNAYSQAFSTSGGIAPYSYAIVSGSLPSGMTLAPGGLLSGTPTATGISNFSLRSMDANSASITQSYSLAITAPGISLTPAALSPMQVGSASSQSFSASGGSGPYTYAVTSGALPVGMMLNTSTGSLSGTPTIAGGYAFTITATDRMGFTGSRSYGGTIDQGAPVAGPISLTVSANSTANPVTLNLSGGTTTSVAVVVAASNGVAVANGTSITYKPNAGFSGSDSFTYNATGPGGTSNAATVSVTVMAPTIVLTPTSIPSATVATAYSVTLGASGGSAPYTYSLTGGTLPAGLSLSAGGLLSGTPTAAGSFNFTVTATDNNGMTGTQAYSLSVGQAAPVAGNLSFFVPANSSAIPVGLILSGGPATSVAVVSNGGHGVASASGTSISYKPNPGFAGSDSFTYTATGPGGTSNTATVSVTVTAPTIALTPTTIPGATVATAYSATLTASGGSSPYTYSLTTGTLPAGISVSTAGVLSGTPMAAGSFNFTITATDSTGFTGTQAYNLSVGEAVPVAGNISLTVAANSNVNPVTLNLSGGPVASVAVASNASHGVASASGTSITYKPNPGFAGSDSFTYTATGPGGTSNTATVSVTVTAPTIALTPTSIPGATVATAYSATLTASGGSSPYTYSLTTGTLPAGISLSTAGVLSGTPTAAGSFNFTITATDNTGFTGTQAYNLSVGEAAPVAGNISLTVAANSNVNPVTLNLSGGPVASVAVASNASHGVASASGTSITYKPNPGFAGSDSFTYTATGPGGTSNTATVSVTVTAPTIALTPTSIPGATVATAYSATLTASGGSSPYTYSLTTGTLPAGISLSTAGVLSGTPTAAGSFNFTITATDNTGFTGTQAYNLSVGEAAPVAGNISLTVAANSNVNPVTLNLSGGPVASVAVASNASHGVASASGTSITYKPNPGFAGSDSFTYTATGPGGTSNTATVSVTVTAPTIALTPTSIPGATVATAYSATLGASGGAAPYTFSVTAGTLPAGITLSTAGVLSGTPTAAGNFNFTITATDHTGFSGAQAFSVAIANQAPVAGAVSASIAANSSATPIDLVLDGGAASSIAVSTAPSHGTATVSGLRLSYTPKAGYSGSDSFAYTVTGPGGTSAPATVTITVSAPTLAITPTTPNLPPAIQGQAYSASLGASGGTPPYRYAVAGTLPAGLTLDSASGSVSGTPTTVGDSSFTISVTDANGATGSQLYNLSTAAQAVVVPPSSETLAPGQAATVDLTRGASGGPFLRARLLSVSPAAAGSASLSGPFTLNFTPAAAFAGTAVVAFSLENTGGNSTSSTVTFTVQPRPDPTRDAEVIGLLNAQSRAAERFASTQMDNFNRRLEQLHRPTCDRDSFNANVRHGRDDVSLGGLGKALRDELEGNGKGQEQEDERRRQEKDSAQATSGECREEALAFWTDGFVNTGSNRARGAKDNSFTTFGLSAGMDYRLSPRAVVGVGIGYGNDRTDVGEQDSRSDGDALGLAAYLSVNPLSEMYVDALLGYNRIRFDSRRYVTANPSEGYAHGSRDADQLFASLTASYEYRQGALSLAPYARVNSSYTRLDAYSERGGGIYGLSYDEQNLRNVTSFLGVRSAYDIQTGLGVLTPRVGLAWGHNFERNEDYRMRYTDQGSDGMLYRLSPDPQDSNFMDLDLGLDLSVGRAWRVGFSYKTALGTDERSEMFRLGLEGRF
ncbi:putative Ig domain-containing protein [Pseudomonas sp.]|uniref:putative Ig domain-containing protein n=1 Tax=Pseudomonas sp. TaxID=306 RepID=UPI0028B17856|nr:putative Ig domain-containing protein [Pseudomonas sp.]